MYSAEKAEKDAIEHGITKEEYAKLIASLNELGVHLMKFDYPFIIHKMSMDMLQDETSRGRDKKIKSV